MLITSKLRQFHAEVFVLGYTLRSLTFRSRFFLTPNQVEWRHLWRFTTMENRVQHAWIKAKQSPVYFLLWALVYPTCPFPVLGFPPTQKLCPHPRRHQGQIEDGQSCVLGPAVSRGRLSLLLWLLNASQLHVWCLTKILEWTDAQICKLLIWTRASACSISFQSHGRQLAAQSHEVWGSKWELVSIRDAGYPEWPVDVWRVWVCAASGISVFSVLCLGAGWAMTRVCS